MVKSLDTDIQNAKKGEGDNDAENFWSNEGKWSLKFVKKKFFGIS